MYTKHSKMRQILGTGPRPEKPAEPVLIAAQTGITIKFAGLQPMFLADFRAVLKQSEPILT
jgi:hypothetical protein